MFGRVPVAGLDGLSGLQAKALDFPRFHDPLLLVGARRHAERDWDRAKQAYLMALGLRSDLPDVHYGLATVYFQLNELTSAAHHFREVTRLDPLRAGAYINLGAVLNLLQELEEAILALRRGI
ncbi:MAG TPA: tetratricopeptide repeat protein, partial [Gemmataceae bacterium]